jgi:peptidoglycan glycosyltransferase
MGRRIRWLALALVVCFAAVVVQLLNIQFREATRLNAATTNPRNATKLFDNQRGMILASNGQVLAKSVAIPNATPGQFQYRREYPTGPLFSGVVGYDSPAYYGTSGVEYAYDKYLTVHTPKAATLGQLLNPPAPTTDNVTTTIIPSLQQLARQQLASVPSANQDGAVTVLTVKTAAVLAMYSSPTYTNNALATLTRTKVVAAGKADFQTTDHEGFYPGYPMATFDAFAPGSTFKVVTSSAVYNLKPSLETFDFPIAGCTKPGQIPDTNKVICNDSTTPAAANPCGGKMITMLPQSCDPGYALLGIALGGTDLYKQSEMFGFNQRPPIDLEPSTVSKSYFPTPRRLAPTGTLGIPGVALSAFGQQTVTETDLQNAMVAEAIANTGVMMTPHVMKDIRNATGALVTSYTPTVYKHAESATAARAVNFLMQHVPTTPKGTAYGDNFPRTWDIAVKTGTSQAGPHTTNTTDWMIGFAPAYHPVVAISVVVPLQAISSAGATIAGPIMKAMMTAALKIVPHPSAPVGTTTLPTSSSPSSSTTSTTSPATPTTTTPTTTTPTTTTPTTTPPSTTIPVTPSSTTTTTVPPPPKTPTATSPATATPSAPTTTSTPAVTTAFVTRRRTPVPARVRWVERPRRAVRHRRMGAHAGRGPPRRGPT